MHTPCKGEEKPHYAALLREQGTIYSRMTRAAAMIHSMMQEAASMHLSRICAPCKQQGGVILLCFAV